MTTREHTLLKFLHRNNTLLYDEGSAAELVDELHRRWAERSANDNGQEPVNNVAAKLNSISSSKAATNTVFLSYASEDRGWVTLAVTDLCVPLARPVLRLASALVDSVSRSSRVVVLHSQSQ